MVDAEIDAQGRLIESEPEHDVLYRQINALQAAIATLATSSRDCPSWATMAAGPFEATDLGLLTAKTFAGMLAERMDATPALIPDAAVLCPLTLHLPEPVSFAGQAVYRACRDVAGLRQRVKHQLQVRSGHGQLWLPVVWTARGPLYGEAIGLVEPSVAASKGLHYRQPVHLSDQWRQPLYRLAQGLLRMIGATPAVYLLQFGLDADRVYFDCLLPFPAAPAIASVGVQHPDLFQCHLCCLMGLPVLDLFIFP